MSYIYIYICAGEVKDGTTSIFINSKYNSWFKELRGDFYQLSLMINIIIFVYWIKLKEKSRWGTIDQKTVNKTYLCYQCFIYGP